MKNSSNHFRKAVALTALLSVSAMLSGAFGHAATSIDRIVAIAGDDIITQSALDRIIRARKDAGEPVDSKEEHWGILRQLIEEQLIVQEAEKRGLSVTENELEFALNDIQKRNRFPDRETFKEAVSRDHLSWAQYAENLKKQLMALKLLSREVNTTVSLDDDAVKEYYRKHPKLFQLPDRVKIRQILLPIPDRADNDTIHRIKEKAEKIYNEARSGTEFRQLVDQYSQGREKRDGGDLGYFKKGDLAQTIDDALFSSSEGDVTPPIQTPLGFHIFKIDALEIGRLRPFETVERQIKERLITEKTADLRSKWIADLWERSFVEIK
ncbi:MAG: peptidylprolyl isomerase [Nitrospiria bacterium]